MFHVKQNKNKNVAPRAFSPVHFIFTCGHSGAAKAAEAPKRALPFAYGREPRRCVLSKPAAKP
jgi:hypothetical protein